MLEIAKIRVDGAFANVVERRVIPSGLVGGTIRVEYAPGIWDNLTKTVVFKGVTTKDITTQKTVIEIPSETVAAPDKRLRVGFYGVDASGVQIIPTLWADLGLINPAADPSGDPSVDPSLPVWAQLADKLRELEESGGADPEQIKKIVDEYLEENPPTGGNAEKGEDGFSPIATVTQTATGAVISVTDANGTTTATITNGKDGKDGADGAKGDKGDPGEKGETGAQGIQGVQGEKGEKGDTGATGADGAKGDKGDKGDTGETGAQGEPGKDGSNGADGYSVVYCGYSSPDDYVKLSYFSHTPKVGDIAVCIDGNVCKVLEVYGNDVRLGEALFSIMGQDGSSGKDGTSVTVKSVSESTADGGSNVVTFSDGKTITIKNGNTGATGSNGADGVSPTVAVSKSGKVTTISITDVNGTKTATINDGADGKDGTGGQMDNGFGYAPTGGSLDASHLEKMRYWNAPIYDGNIPVFRLTEEKPAMTDATCTPDALYAMYDALAVKHPQYIKKYDMGLCSDGVQHVYRYDFVEPEPHHSSDTKEWDEQKIKIIIGSGIHWEWGSMFGLFNALEEITENEELLDFRRNTHLIVIPCMNPYSALHGSMSNLALMRQNANGVEIHRNFEVGFKYPGDSGYYDPSSHFHGGKTPLSEVESQYIDKIMRENTDAALFMSCHGYDWNMDRGTDDRGIGFIWVSAATAYTCNMGYRLIDKLSRSWMADYGDTLSAGIESYKTAKLEDWDTRLGFAYMSSTNGSEQRQGTKYGIQSTNVEMCETFGVHGTRTKPEAEFSSFTMSRGTEVYINYLLMIAGCYDFKDKAFYGMDAIESEEPETPYEPIEPENPEPVVRLPAEYQEVECNYNAEAGPYIKTGVNGKTGLEVLGTFKSYPGTISAGQYIVGSTNASNQRCYVNYNDVNTNYEFGAISYQAVYANANTFDSKITFTAKWETSGCLFTASNVTDGYSGAAISAFDNGSEMTIWGRNKSGTVTANAVFYLYALEIYENGVQTRNFVPCYRKSDNVAGLYDTVNNMFYSNSGTGTFLKGADLA